MEVVECRVYGGGEKFCVCWTVYLSRYGALLRCFVFALKRGIGSSLRELPSKMPSYHKAL